MDKNERTFRKLGREKAVFATYQWLLTNASEEDLLLYINMNKVLSDSPTTKQYALNIVFDVMEHYAIYRLELSNKLKQGWTFERLSFLERAILLVACSEIKTKVTPKPVACNEATELAKKYCDETSYRFINGVLKNVDEA